MPFRERMRRAFGRASSGSQSRAGAASSSTAAAAATTGNAAPPQSSPQNGLTLKRTRSQKANLYRIGEHMPPTKYPCKYDKPHQDLLRAFSWNTALGRRRSDQTEISPMGSRLASRRNSEAGGRKSTSHRPSNVAQLVKTVDAEKDDGDETSNDDDVTNVALSRQVTAEPTWDDDDADLELVTAPSTPIEERPATPNGAAHLLLPPPPDSPSIMPPNAALPVVQVDEPR